MRFGFFALPLGLLEMVLIAVVIILILKAITGNKHAGRTIVTVLIAVSAVMVISIGALFLALFATQTVTVNHTAQQQAVIVTDQGRADTERARKHIEAMAQEVRAKADEIRDRTLVQVDRIVTVPMPADNPGVSNVADSPAQPSNASVQSGVFETETSIGSWSVSGAPSSQSGVIETETSIGSWSVSGAPSSNAAQKPRGITVEVNTPYTAAPDGSGMPMAHTMWPGVGSSRFLLVVLAVLGTGFFVLITVVIAVIARHRGRRHVMGRALAGGAVATIVMAVCFVALMYPTVQHNTTSTHYSVSNPPVLAEQALGQDQPLASQLSQDEAVSGQGSGVTVAGQPWSSAVEEYQDFEADVYPSLEAAAEALGRRAGQEFMGPMASVDGDTPSLYVWRDAGGGDSSPDDGTLIITPEVLETIASGMRQKLLDPAYVSVEMPPTPDAITVRVMIPSVTFDNHNRWRKHTESKSGGIAIRTETSGGPFYAIARFVDAPWLENRSAFAKNFPNGDWLVGYSDGTHATHADAQWDALTTASEALLPLARARINHMSGSDQHQFNQQMAKNPNWLRDRVADELRSRNMVTDQFTQQFDRSYGPVWREAILVDASPNRVEEIARSLVKGINVRVSHQKTTWFSYIALAALVIGTYLFLNMATKGYYAWSLRAALVIGLVAVAVIILNYT